MARPRARTDQRAYDITGAEIPAVFAGVIPQPIAVYYVTYLLVAANPIHHLYDATSGIFRAPYASRVRTLFGSNVTEQDLMAALPQTLDELLTPRGMALVRDAHGPLAKALRAADHVCSWSPRTPVRLYFVSDDEQVTADNVAPCRA